MKKVLTIAVLTAAVVSAPAATLKWGWGSGSLFVAKTGESTGVAAAAFTGTVSDGAYLALVYLGTSDSFVASSVTENDVVDRIAYGVDGDVDESFWSPATKNFNVTETTGYSVGDSFGVAFFDGKAFASIYDIADWDSGTLGNALTPVVTITDLDSRKVFSVNPSDISTDGAAAVVVPEPGTAALALLGIGMLIRRRRA